MNDYLLLKDRNRCPRCDRHGISWSGGCCIYCQVRVFKAGQNWRQWMADTSLREFWLYTNDKGWMHSSHLLTEFSPDGPRPIRRDFDRPLPDKDYGTQPLPPGCSAGKLGGS